MKTITIFGSSYPMQGDQEYDDAFLLGKILGENGFNICSGGYLGIMEAVSKGARESGVEVIGVTVEIFKSIPNKYLTEVIECDSLFERIKTLVTIADGYVILSGGTGTFLELAVIWEYFNKGLIPAKPVAVYGKMWKNIIDEMEARIKIEKRKSGLVEYAASISECSQFMINSLKD